ncbi:hypothetical protein GCM10009619_17270 [Williamsia maris]
MVGAVVVGADIWGLLFRVHTARIAPMCRSRSIEGSAAVMVQPALAVSPTVSPCIVTVVNGARSRPVDARGQTRRGVTGSDVRSAA